METTLVEIPADDFTQANQNATFSITPDRAVYYQVAANKPADIKVVTKTSEVVDEVIVPAVIIPASIEQSYTAPAEYHPITGYKIRSERIIPEKIVQEERVVTPEVTIPEHVLPEESYFIKGEILSAGETLTSDDVSGTVWLKTINGTSQAIVIE